ncbi:hypothetical protein LIER_03524 [Lithospermum erythrorhizon]|uniref:Uncharacterized protein n=1 Tax=Lithospermum erythrorhizon TaxID=34254 RepID=A0AAV3NTX2_LITER
MKYLSGTFVMKNKEGFTSPGNKRSNDRSNLSDLLAIDRLVNENRDRLAKEAVRAEEAYVNHESYTTDDPPYTPTYSPLYTNSMFPEYGDTRSH